MWDPYVLWHAGEFHMIHMVGTNDADYSHRAMCMARSVDGVHWEDLGVIADGREPGIPIFAGCFWRAADRFIMNHGSVLSGSGRHSDQCIRFWESPDLQRWTYRGDDAAVFPDPRWYGTRWDCMDAIPRDGGGFWGYITGDTLDAHPGMSVGMLQSDDGIEWEAIPPPVIEWGDLPQQMMEVGSCERIDGRYYLILGAFNGYLGNRGYSMFTFVADEPTGPFRPDVDAYRLCGSGPETANWLANFCRTPGALLTTNSIAHACPGPDVWFAPMKRAVVDAAGHLRLHYWEGNDAVRGTPVEFARNECELVHPAAADEHRSWQCTEHGLSVHAKREGFSRLADGPFSILILPEPLDVQRGVVIEGTMRLEDTVADDAIKTHMPPSAVGPYVEHAPGSGTAALFETSGLTRIARLAYSDVGVELSGEDITGPGCATVRGIPPRQTCSFRLFLRRDMMEVYLDDRLAQTCYVATERTGRVGLVVQNGACAFENLNIWTMNLEA